MANNFTEQLFNAIDIIASKKVADLPYDKTVICKITDNTNAENGEYTVSDGTSEYLAYSENTSYRVSSKVYVTIPGSDMLNKKLIVGQYIEDSNGIYETYISPMNNFVDCTGDLAQSTLTGPFSLLANDKDVKFKTIWDSGIVSYKDFTCLGIQGEFMSIFNGEKPVEGNYGLAIYVQFHRSIPVQSENGETKIEIQDDLLLNKVYYLDSSDMFGDPYNFETGYLQEKIFEIVGMAEIVNIQLAFYQSENFKLEDNSAWDNSGMLENLFVSNVQLKLGELLSDYEEDTLKLICNDKLSYRCDELPLERTMYLRWIHLIEESAIVIDEAEDVELADELTVENTLGALVPNWRLHWYRYNMVNGVKDRLAGNFWVEQEADESIWSRTIIPDDTVQHDKWKVILEYPRADVIYDSMIEQTDANYQALFEAAVAAIENTTASVSTFTAQVNAYITDTPLGEDDTIIDFYDVYCNNQALYPTLYKSEDIANLKTYITERKSVINYYTSNIITFDNEIQVSLEAVDLVQGLTIEVDTDPTGYNGHYFIYDEGHNIINSHEASKTRVMTAKYTSIATGEDELTQAEEILWCFPLENSMIEMPQEGKEYFPDNGDIYLVTNQLNKTLSVENEQNERSELLKEKRAESYVNDLTREVKELQDRMALEIQSIQVNSNQTLEQYQAEVNNIKEYYELAINYAINRDYSSQFDSFPACRYGIIHRTGGELVGVTDQLIETVQTFRIKDYYAESATNNTIFCFVKKRGRYYKAETLLQFGTAGTSGTELTLKVSLRDANNREVSALTQGGSVTVMAELYDYNNQLLPFTSAVGFKWFSKPLNEGAITITPVDNCAILTSNIDYSNPNGVEPHAHAILQIETEYGIAGDITVDEDDETEIDRERMVTLTSYLPIPVRRSEHFSHISGATQIIYDSNGVNPSYYKSPYCIYSDGNEEELQSAWLLLGTDDELYYDNSRRYYPTLTEYGELLPTNMYYNNIKPISVLGYVVNGEVNEETGVGTFSLAWVQPIFIGQNKYGSTMLNNWDGSLQIDEKNGTIMSAMVGAGIKNEDNTFSGALMGNVALADEKIGNKTGLGIYGFDHGEQSFGLNVDGTAFFGKAGKGRIEFDGNKGLIKSYNYEEPKRSTNNGEVTQTTGEGIQIDLDDSTFKSYGSTGSVVINTNKYGQPLFVIRDAPTVENSKGNALFYISSNSYDPGARRSYDAKYYLQSSNYNDKDPNNTLEDYPEGARFDLEYGRLDIHGKAGRVFINGSGNSDLFKIKGWKTSGGNLISNTLMNVSPNYYYLQSLDYKANQKGFKLDMLNGRILASDFNLKAGTDATGKIQINTNGSPYLSITSGKDYIEEEVNGQIHYVAYNAIDVANVDARFEANRYYVKNKRTSGHYGVEDYLGKYVCGNELIPTMDEEERKTQYYYTQRKNESGELVYDEQGNIIYDQVIAPMWPNDTRSFAASRQPDAERLYIRQIAPIKLDDKSYYRTTVHYYTDIDGTTEITDIIKNPANNYHFTEMKDAGKLYKQPKTPLSAAGTAYIEGRRYYEKVGNDYVEVKRILPNSADCVLWQAKQFYFCTDFGLFVFSTLNYAGDQIYYVPVDGSRVGNNGYTNTELKNLTSAAFIPSSKKVVHPNTKFYDQISNSLYYYSNDWSQVGKDETYDDTQWRYGLKLGTNNSMSTGKTVVADDVPIYKSGTYYVKDENDFVYVEATTWNNNVTYYYLWYDLYEECTKVIPDENEEFGYIFEPNKYFEYVSNKPYILAKEFDSTDVYYTDQGQTVITLCDLDFTPYVTALSLYNNNNQSLVYLNNGTYTTAPPVANFIEGAEYYIRTDYGTTPSPESSLNSVKLVNITKSKFELKSHNWNSANQTGMHFYISSNSTDNSVGQENGTVTSDEDNGTQFHDNGSLPIQYVGAGYIRGYGYYLNNAGVYQRPEFILDWRAGGSHYPIKIGTSGQFKVYWNGRVDMQDLHAYQGRIGSWYIDNNGIYSYNPNKPGYGEGVALIKNGVADNTGGHPVAMKAVKGSVNGNQLRIAVGSFTVINPDGSPGTDDDELIWSGTSTGFSVYNNGFVRMYGARIQGAYIANANIHKGTITSATINSATITNGSISSASIGSCDIDDCTITNGSIGSASINDCTITNGSISSADIGDCSITGTLTGGTISGTTVKATTVDATGVHATGQVSGSTCEFGSGTVTGALSVGSITNAASLNGIQITDIVTKTYADGRYEQISKLKKLAYADNVSGA